MSTRTSRKRAHTHPPDVVQKPRGTFHPRVREVGPEHFGIVAVELRQGPLLSFAPACKMATGCGKTAVMLAPPLLPC